MFIISNHLTEHNFLINDDYVIRINLAWIENIDELIKILKKTKQKIFIDIPSGRKKPPALRFNILGSLDIIHYYTNVKYVAFSNIETHETLAKYKKILSRRITIVPKIETVKGVENISNICKGITDMIMLDKEDLYTDCWHKYWIKPTEKYNRLLDTARTCCYNNNIKLLELQGVVFCEEKWTGKKR